MQDLIEALWHWHTVDYRYKRGYERDYSVLCSGAVNLFRTYQRVRHELSDLVSINMHKELTRIVELGIEPGIIKLTELESCDRER